jgi:DNA repair protein SbcC/Rad50
MTMRLRSLQLENIRSHVQTRVEFPKGITLLRGDIGSGKSTILQGIEFALFGILRGILSGTNLLRHGETKGSVTLAFEVQGKEIFIKRTLKRSKERVEQNEGVLIIDEVVQNLTPTELKVRILELLGYPLDLLNKSKSMVYRYTVYTPQESMKQILLDPPEHRIEILRKLFAIDKYQRIHDNLHPYIRSLREKKANLKGQTSNELTKKNELIEVQKEKSHKTDSLTIITEKIKEQQSIVEVKKGVVTELEKKLRFIQEQKNKLIQAKSLVETSKQKIELLERQLNTVVTEITDIDVKAKPTNLEVIREKKTQKNDELGRLQQEHNASIKALTTCSVHADTSRRLHEQISRLTDCPTCMQEVSSNHKNMIVERETQKMQRMNEKKAEYKSKQESIQKSVVAIQGEIRELQKQKAEQKAMIDMQQRGARLRQQQEIISGQIESLKKQIIVQESSLLSLTTTPSTDIEIQLKESRKLWEDERTRLQDLQVASAKATTAITHYSTQISRLQKELETIAKVQKEAEAINNREHWLSNFFGPTVKLIEKQVMARVYHGFNDLFIDWFTTLIEDTDFSARLDDEFTPIIQQGGYDTSMAQLSGGERTAAALAYRLALAKAVNAIISSIHTRDLIMLDEPTDGFSSEQLERMRKVIDELAMKQVIIVSHERAMEGFVHNVIEVQKIHGQSTCSSVKGSHS